MLQIRIIQPGGDEVVHEVPGHQAIIGRAPDNDVVIPERYISARHAKVLFGLVVTDLDSTNGTFVDGTRVRSATLIQDGEFQLGGEVGDARVLVTTVNGDDSLDKTFSGESIVPVQPERERASAPAEFAAVKLALQERVGQLEAEKAELQARVERLQRDLAAAKR